jgi:hypothetical protein
MHRDEEMVFYFGSDITVGIATATGWTAEVRFSAEVKAFLCFTAFRPALGPMLPPIQRTPGSHSPRGVKRLLFSHFSSF